MEGSPSSSVTLFSDNEAEAGRPSLLRLDHYPPMFVLEAHLTDAEIRKVEDQLHRAGASLTYDPKEACIILGAIEKERRAKFELKRADVEFTELAPDHPKLPPRTASTAITGTKKRKLLGQGSATNKKRPTLKTGQTMVESDSSTDSDSASRSSFQLSTSALPTSYLSSEGKTKGAETAELYPGQSSGVIKVVNLRWLMSSVGCGKPKPFGPYTVLDVQRGSLRLANPMANDQKSQPRTHRKEPTSPARTAQTNDTLTKDILERAQNDPKPKLPRFLQKDRTEDEAMRDFVGRSFASSSKSFHRSARTTRLLHETTSEHEEADKGPLPSMPKWVIENVVYSCQRPTPLTSPNDEFIALLQKIKKARLLTADEIGVRAYSTSIAALAAYPHKLASPREILALPGCDSKIAALFSEYRDNGTIRAATDIDNDPILRVLGLFYEIWGVGATTAREFYYQNHWRDLDDIVINGWKSLNRVQQIGLKYYDDFLLRIPCSEVEAIAEVVHFHAKAITGDKIQCITVGGHRRGKSTSGDVDIILSHPNESVTLGLVEDIVDALEDSGEITHTLSKTLTNTHRDQQPLDTRPGGGGHGFDTLDKALVVWQKQDWPGKEHDIATNQAENESEIARAEKEGREPKTAKVQNPNPHQRVDIIISPWKTVGCAVAGWTSGTTFQRDLRRYAKKVKGWKFDSSGVRDRATGKWIDLEGWRDPETRCTSWQEAERRVFVNMGLEYYEPWERCTG